MGECCSNSNYPVEKKIFESFEKIEKNKIDNLNIITYDENCKNIFEKFQNIFNKLGQFQLLRVNFINELKKQITNIKEPGTNNYKNNNIKEHNDYGNSYYFYQMNKNNNMNNFDETKKILYYIIIMTLLLKQYLKRKLISNELEISLLELSVIIINKKYSNKDLKLILFYLSKMFEILFINIHNIQNFINLKEYLTKIYTITENINLLTKEEKYLFIKTHMISLGEWFHNDYKTILIENSFRFLLLKYYVYLFVQNYEFILENYSKYENNITQKEQNNIIYIEDYYNENDLIQQDNDDIALKKKEEDLYKISYSMHYFFIICTEDIFTGKNIFYEFGNILNNEIISNNLQNDINLIKFKKSIFHIVFQNLLTIDYSTTLLFSFLDYIIEYQKLGISNSDTYYRMIMNLYGRFNNNRIFLDKYSNFVCRIFITEIENSQKEKMIIDQLYRYINDLNDKNNYNSLDEVNMKIKNQENIYFFINLFKNISFYYNKQNNNRIINDILIYLNNLACIIRKDYQKKTININKYNNKYLYENINIILKNFNRNQNDFSFYSNEDIQFALSKFLSSYILMINDLCQINYKDILSDFDISIINIISILEIKIIKYNKIKTMKKIKELLNLLIKHLNSKQINDQEEIKNSLKNNLRLIKNQAYIVNTSQINIQFTTFQLKVIYIIIIIILINLNKNNSETQMLLLKHNKILLKIKQFNKVIGSCFLNLSDKNNINIENMNNLLQGQIYAITYISFARVIEIFQKELFNDDSINDNENINHNEQINFRSRTLYQNDKNGEMKINIDTKNNYYYNTKTHLLTNSNLINDSFSKYSFDTFSHKKINSGYTANYNNNNDMFSEKIKMPKRDSFNHNQKINTNNLNVGGDDIISNKSSLRNFEIKI